MINNSYRQLNGIVVQFTTARGAAQRVFEMMDNLPDVDLDAGRFLERSDIRGDIALHRVDFAYQMRSRSKVLKGVELQINAGQVCALVGKSGGGKSTLVHLLMRFYDPTAVSQLRANFNRFQGNSTRYLCLSKFRCVSLCVSLCTRW
jgi:ABC-type multidrug transport system fused ATPase/permease subunit